jgi:two-component system CheB/CheR fusion protein
MTKHIPAQPGVKGPAQATPSLRLPPPEEQAAGSATITFPADITPRTRSTSFAVVAVGASSGDIDPLLAFAAQIAVNSGIAWVVIQHHGNERKASVKELLQSVSMVPVVEAVDGMALAPNRIHVLRHSQESGLEDGRFRLKPQRAAQDRGLPINAFFTAIAASFGDRCAGVILSGMGADGTRGLQAIKRAGGLTVAQLPESARFDPMPLSAIAAQVIDLVVLPDQMPGRIVAWFEPASVTLDARREDEDLLALAEIIRMLSQHTGSSFVDYKTNTVIRRIERRTGLHQLDSMRSYVSFLRANPPEVELLFKELLIGVTSFFRDPKVWDYLGNIALPRLLADYPEGRAFKAWVPACSTGEEAYSLAMAFSEAVSQLESPARFTLQIFATDLSSDAIDRARQGRYNQRIAGVLSPQRLQRFFVAEPAGYQVRAEIRNMIIFAQQNIVSDPPFTKLDILCCRNLLIYFNTRLQQRLIPLFHYALNPGGLLLLGSADTPGHFSELFAPFATSSRLYRRLDDPVTPAVATYFPTRVTAMAPSHHAEPREASMAGNIQSNVEQLLLQKYSPAAALLNREGDILYIHGRTGGFLEPAAGQANWNIHVMARDGLRFELGSLIKEALQSDGVVRSSCLAVHDELGRQQGVVMTVEALRQPHALEGMLFVTFNNADLAPDTKEGGSPDPKVAELERLLVQARSEIHAVRNEMQSSREELKSANEELQSTNEELQSTNEELTTSKEEMQSLNEELYTVNAELQSKVDDLSMINSDMKNLLNSTDIATVFLDSELRIRRFTTAATRIFKLIAGDLHRPLSDIASDLEYPTLEEDAREVAHTLIFSEKQVATRSGRWYTVRIMPYRTIDNVIDGVVLTLINITDSKLLEAQLRVGQQGDDELEEKKA